MLRPLVILSFLIAATFMHAADGPARPISSADWIELPQLPDPLGVGGGMVGVSNNVLIVAGGTNFLDGVRPWNAGVKQWHDAIYVLPKKGSNWKACPTRLPKANGYAAAISTPEGLWIIGGSDRERHFAATYCLNWNGHDIEIRRGPNLTTPIAYSAGALVGSKLIIAGGTDSPTATAALQTAYELDLAEPADRRTWNPLPPFPGPERFLAAAASVNGQFYLVGGIRVRADAAGAPERIKPFLNDMWRFSPGANGAGDWTRLPDLPEPRAACPTPAATIVNGFTLFSGDDGSLTPALKDTHPGFPASIWQFEVAKSEWRNAGSMPKQNGADAANHPDGCVWPPVTTGLTIWNDRIVIPSGEIRPGVRTRRVLALPLSAFADKH